MSQADKGKSGNKPGQAEVTAGLPLKVKCPRCGAKARYRGNPYRPFCSERCQMFDRAAWADGEYALPSEDAPGYDPE